MTYEIEHKANRIIIFRMLPGYHFDNDAAKAQGEVATLLDSIKTQPIFLITDFSRIQMSFGDLVMKLGNNTHGRKGSISDPRVKNIFVGTDELVNLAAESLYQTQYGKLPTLVFTTMSEALTYAEAMLI